MTKNKTRPEAKNALSAAYKWTAVLAAAAGFVAVYVYFAHYGNGGSRTGQTPPAATQQTAVSGLAAHARGEVAAFVARGEPEPVPSFTFTEAGGPERSLADWRGKVVLVNLWATWCGPCRHEMPSLDALKRELGGSDFDVVAISVDRGDIEKPRQFLEEIKVKDLVLYHEGSGKLIFKLKAVGLPTTLLLDREGRELGRMSGPAEWASDDAKALIRAAIGNKG